MGHMMSSKSESRAEAVRFAEQQKTQRIGSMVVVAGQVLTVAVRWGFAFLIAMQMSQAVQSMAGKQTDADVNINAIFGIEVKDVLMSSVAVGGVLYGLRQRQLRQDTIQENSEYQKALEQVHDPTRTSSHLTTRGTTNPKDL